MSVSVIIPTYNCAAYLPEAIDSVLRQSVGVSEIIVVDDGSSDETQTIARGWTDPLIYIRQENQGVSTARNAGLARARGEYVAFLDADDVWETDKLAIQLAVLRANDSVVGVFSDFSLVDEQGHKIRARHIKHKYRVFAAHGLDWDGIFPEHRQPAPAESGSPGRELRVYHGDIFSSLFLGNFILTSSLLLRRRGIDLVGEFNVQRRTQEDYEYFLKMAFAGPFAYVDCPLLSFRARPFQLTAPERRRAIAEDTLDVVEAIAPLARSRLPEETVTARLGDRYRALAAACFGAGDREAARRVLRCALALRPTDTRALGLYCWSVVPQRAGDHMRRLIRSSGLFDRIRS